MKSPSCGTALAGDTHSLARRTNPPTACIVHRHGVAKGKGDKHLRPPQKLGRPALYLVVVVT